ncbi:hypothetical protein D3C71_1246360 [compost metagenome]
MLIAGVVVSCAKGAVGRLPVGAGTAARAVVTGVSLTHAVGQVSVFQQCPADPGLPAVITIAVTTGRSRSVGTIKRAIPAITVLGKQAKWNRHIERSQLVRTANAYRLVPRPGYGVTHAANATGIAQLIPDAGIIGSPVGLLAARHVDRAVISQRLGNIHLEAAFFIPRQVVIALHIRHAVIVFGVAVLIAFHRFPRHVVQGVKPFSGIAIAEQLEVGSETVQ